MNSLTLAAAALLVMAHPVDLNSCGPFLPSAIFSEATVPDNERAFFSGQLGIVQPTMERRYLAMAYRIMSGEPLSPAQVDAVVDLGRYRSPRSTSATGWLSTRSQVAGVAPLPQLEAYRFGSNYVEVLVCNSDAFVTAAKTLSERIQQAGAGSAEVRDWVAAQDKVFSNCSGGRAIPEAAPAGSSARVVADRNYQVAAALFYSGDYDAARAAWNNIAADKTSPWREWAPYLIARSYLRQDRYGEAVAQLKTIAAEKPPGIAGRPAEMLLPYAEGRAEPGKQLTDLSKRLLQKDASNLGHDLSDFTYLIDRLQEEADSGFDAKATREQAMAASQARMERLHQVDMQTDLSAWITEYQSLTLPPERHDEAERWRKTQSVAWLLAAAHRANPKASSSAAADMQAVTAALLDVKPSSPAYATARYEAARLLIYSRQDLEAARVLNQVLDADRFGTSASNAFHGARMKVDSSFEETLRDLPRRVDVVSDEGDEANGRRARKSDEPKLQMDWDGAFLFNEGLPLSFWKRAADNAHLPENLRIEIAQAGWVRTVLIDGDSGPWALALAKLKPSYAADLQGFESLAKGEQRPAEWFWMLRHPELSPQLMDGLARMTPDGKIDNLRDNWWCPDEGSKEQSQFATNYAQSTPVLGQLYANGDPPQARFLTAVERARLAEERKSLQQAGGAPGFLAREVLQWAAAHPDDKRSPEVLALVVRVSHYGCGDPDGAKSVEQAFHLLHSRYPGSKWARQTPYWYR